MRFFLFLFCVVKLTIFCESIDLHPTPKAEIVSVREGTDIGGIWKSKMHWKAHWVKNWETRQVWVAMWRKIWAPMEVKEWVPLPPPPPSHHTPWKEQHI